MTKPLLITDLALRDASQSLLATPARVEDMLAIATKLDEVGYWSLDVCGDATFDTCIRSLAEDPWERLRLLKSVMPNTPLQMLLRGQSILGHRHYADDLVDKFVERAAVSGIDIFRVIDAMNDTRNLQTSIKAAVKAGKHAQGAMAYTLSPSHSNSLWVDMARRLEDMGCHSICIQDVAGLLKPYTAEELVSRIKEKCTIPLSMHCHAASGLSAATYLKAVEAGVDMIDTSISPTHQTSGHTATETIVSLLEENPRAAALDHSLLEEIANDFRRFTGTVNRACPRVLSTQIPVSMITNVENQLREQNADDQLDQVLAEVHRVREDLGNTPLVTPTAEIIANQAILNVLTGERYKTLSKETVDLLKGAYGATASAVNQTLQQRVLDGSEVINCRPADLIEPELEHLSDELQAIATEQNIELADNVVDDVLTYALFHHSGIQFLKNRNNPGALEPTPTEPMEPAPTRAAPPAPDSAPERYRVMVNGTEYDVLVAPHNGDISHIVPTPPAGVVPATAGSEVKAPLAGTIIDILVSEGQQINEGDPVVIIEAMKMETEIRSQNSGTVQSIAVSRGDTIHSDQSLMIIG